MSKLYCFTLLAAAGMTATSVAWAGGAYNGPTLQDGAIPVLVDRALTLEAVRNAYSVCTGEMWTRILEQAQKGPIQADSLWQAEVTFSQDSSGKDGANIRGWFRTKNPFVTGPDGGSVWLNFQNTYPVRYGTLMTNVPRPGDPDHRTIAMRYSGLPAFTFNTTVNEGAYDEYGELLDASRVVVTDLRITNPPLDGQTDRKAIRLKNESTGTLTQITIDLDTWQNCLMATVTE